MKFVLSAYICANLWTKKSGTLIIIIVAGFIHSFKCVAPGQWIEKNVLNKNNL